jgi:hypothetical protein
LYIAFAEYYISIYVKVYVIHVGYRITSDSDAYSLLCGYYLYLSRIYASDGGGVDGKLGLTAFGGV